MQRYVPLTVDLIDEGRFIGDINKALADLQGHLVRHQTEFGEESKGAKVKLTAEIIMGIEHPKDGISFVKSQIKKTLPVAPPSVSRAMSGESQTDEPCLLVRATGSGADAPQQGILTTADGDAVDTETGEVFADEMESGDLIEDD